MEMYLQLNLPGRTYTLLLAYICGSQVCYKTAGVYECMYAQAHQATIIQL